MRPASRVGSRWFSGGAGLKEGATAGGAAIIGLLLLSTSCSSAKSTATDAEARLLIELENLEQRGRVLDTVAVESRLTHSSPRVRARAARALGRCFADRRNPAAATRAAQALLSGVSGEDNSAARIEIWFALELMGARTDGLDVTPDSDVEARVAQGRWLGQALTTDASALLEPWLTDNEPRVRRAALVGRALASVGADPYEGSARPKSGPDAGAPLAGGRPSRSVYADDSDERVRWAHLWCEAWRPAQPELATDELVRAAVEPNFFSAVFALEALRNRAEPVAVEALLEIAGREDVSWLQREAAWHALAVFLDQATLSDAWRASIERAALDSVKQPSPSSAQPLLRQRVVYVLARCRSPDARRWLIEELAPSASADEAIAALRSVAESSVRSSDDDSLAGLLSRWATRSETSVRVAWARAALRTGSRLESERLLRDADAAVRAAAARWAADLSREQTAALLEDPDPRVPFALVWRWLEREELPAPETYAPLLSRGARAEWPLRLLALEATAKSGGALVAPFVAASLADPVPAVARLAGQLSPGRQPANAASFFDLPYTLPRGLARETVLYLRAHVNLSDGRRFLIELLPQDAPHHVAAFVALVRSGFYHGARARQLGVLAGCALSVDVPASHPLADAPLPSEPHPTEILRGSVYSLPATWELPDTNTLRRMRRQRAVGVLGPSRAGSALIAQVPLPALRGVATVWGRVVQGMAVVDSLGENDPIDSVGLAGWNLAPFDAVVAAE